MVQRVQCIALELSHYGICVAVLEEPWIIASGAFGNAENEN